MYTVRCMTAYAIPGVIAAKLKNPVMNRFLVGTDCFCLGTGKPRHIMEIFVCVTTGTKLYNLQVGTSGLLLETVQDMCKGFFKSLLRMTIEAAL